MSVVGQMVLSATPGVHLPHDNGRTTFRRCGTTIWPRILRVRRLCYGPLSIHLQVQSLADTHAHCYGAPSFV